MGLAPTTSTTMQMALGDALAVALLTRRGFTAADFRRFHPGGKLGARLRRVRELMHAGDAMPLAPPDMPMHRALLLMTEKRFGCLGVVEAGGRAGRHRDRRRPAPRHGPGPAVPPRRRDHDPSPRTIGPDALAAEALHAMNAGERPITALVRRRRRPACRSASCISMTCCARGWHDALPPANDRHHAAPLRAPSWWPRRRSHPAAADAAQAGAPAHVLITLTKCCCRSLALRCWPAIALWPELDRANERGRVRRSGMTGSEIERRAGDRRRAITAWTSRAGPTR